MMPFMGHAATAPSSPSGMHLFMEMDDYAWAQGEQIDQDPVIEAPDLKMPAYASSSFSGRHDGPESLIQHPFGDLLPPSASMMSQDAALQ